MTQTPPPPYPTPGAAVTVVPAVTPGTSTSEFRVLVIAVSVIGLLVALFDVVAGTGALAGLPSWAIPAVDGSYLAMTGWMTTNYASNRTALKTAALNGQSGQFNGAGILWTIVAVLLIIALLIFILPHFH